MSRHVEHILLAVLLTTAALAFMGALFVEALPDRGGHVKQRRRSWRLDFDDVSRPRLDGSAGQPPPAAGPGHPEDYDPEFWGEQDVSRPAMGLMDPSPLEAGPGDTYDLEACPNCTRQGFDGILCNSCGWGYGYQPAYEARVTAVLPPGRRQSGDLDDTMHDAPPRVSGGRHAKPDSHWARYTADHGIPGPDHPLGYVQWALTVPLPQVKALTAAS